MTTNYPTSKDDNTSIPVESTGTPLSTNHIESHTNVRDAVIALEDKVGIDGSADTDSHDYKLSEVTGTDKAIAETGAQTLEDKTLGSGTKVALGSDATGDTYYRDASGNLTRLAKGNTDDILTQGASTPQWAANPATTDASTTERGVVEKATATEINNGTATGGAGTLAVTPDSLASSDYIKSSDLPVADIQTFSSNGTWTKPEGAVKVLVQAWGGGGSGATMTSGTGAGATGGGGGEYVEAWFSASELSATEAVVRGAGGAAKTGGANANGNNGSDSTFGSLVTAKGGSRGVYGTPSNQAGGNGGSILSLNVEGLWGAGVDGAAGQSGINSAAGGGWLASGNAGQNGGNAVYGGGGGGGVGNSNSGTGGTSEFGGDGGDSAKAGTPESGAIPSGGGGASHTSGDSGAGGNGQVIVTTFA